MLETILIMLCLALNAVLSGSEMAFVSSGRGNLRELARNGSQRAQRLLEMKNRPERILSIIQIGITLVGAVAAAVGGAGADEVLSPYLETRFQLSPDMAESLSLAMVVIPITLLSVVFGELFPKAIALRDPVRIALAITPFLHFSDKTLSPLINVLENSTNVLLRLFKIRHAAGAEGGSDAERPGYAVSFGIMKRLNVKEIMVPLKDATLLDCNMSIQEVSRIVSESGHTRLPVRKENRITGILNSKEYHMFRDSNQTDWLAIVRGALYLDENTDIMTALKMLQGQRKHMAIVISHGDPVGLVTIEDIIEEFVGDIFDEDDDNLVRQLVRSRAAVRRRL